MPNPYLLLWLEAPLQAWGHNSKFGRRESLNFPTKSGVLGLIFSALGAGGEQTELLAEFANLDQQVISFNRNKNQLHNPQLRDFQMIGGGYDLDDPWQRRLQAYKSDGKPRASEGGGIKMTYRYYLQDACFAVLLEVPADKAEAIAEALQNPVWDIFLGRKNCVPTDFIFRGSYQNASAAAEAALEIASSKALHASFWVVDGQHSGESMTLMDVPTQFGEHKRYRDRQVTLIAAADYQADLSKDSPNLIS